MAPDFGHDRRLANAADYSRVFGSPDFRIGKRELLILARYNDLAYNRLGLAVAKKHVPKAVKRNLIKRLAREHFRHLPAQAQSVDVVVLTRQNARSADREQLNRAFANQFQALMTKAAGT